MKHRTPRLAELFDWRDEATLVPFSGVQILDFGFRLDQVPIKGQRFVERRVEGAASAEAGEGFEVRELIPPAADEEVQARIDAAARDDDDSYTVTPAQALEPFLGKWVPVPVLRIRNERGAGGEECYDAGPSTWARMRVVELPLPEPESGQTHRLQLAFDTGLGERDPAGSLYTVPDRSDAENAREFRLVADPGTMGWFLRRPERDTDGSLIDPQDWVSDWLDALFMAFKRAERPGRKLTRETLPHRFEHWARYLAFLRLVDRAVKIPKLRLLNTVSANDRLTPVDVDLVLDLGNSRTCGILIERFSGEFRVDLTRSFPLELRDLSRPEFLYSGLFESRVELAELRFGDERFASRGRRNGFIWPSFVRIGPEAQRLVAADEGTETKSGISSPKRYIWDDAPMPQDWRFHDHADPNNLPRALRASMRFVNEAGDVIEQIRAEERLRLRPRGKSSQSPAIRPRFSRSALFGFMLAEIFAHALVQVNAPAGRGRRMQSDLPRRLSRIILTLPTATSAQEQAIIRSRADGALKLVWAQLGMAEGDNSIARRPELIVEWDEASCSQLVYLYSELTQKFGGGIDKFFALKGLPRAPRPGAASAPSLRLACLDIGGGTTDLMVTTYFAEANRVLNPVQTFREGARVAGDDLLQRVISSVVLPRLHEQIEAAGGRFVTEKLRELFVGDLGGQDQRKVQKRRQFALRVLMPLAIAVLAACETAEELQRVSVSAAEVLALVPSEAEPGADPAALPGAEAAMAAGRTPLAPELVAYIEDAARDLGAEAFRLADLVVTCTRDEVDAIAREVFQKVMANMVEVIDHLGCDLVLLTGRPSRLAAVRSIVEEMMVVPPDRLISMHSYYTGRWYPFRDPMSQRIGDPKSTVAVGGMLIALAESDIPNFKVTNEAFRMRSTARFIGEMEDSGQILDACLLFSDVDLAEPGAARGPAATATAPAGPRRPGMAPPAPAAPATEATCTMHTVLHIGARQLPLERWMTIPLYRLDHADERARRRRHPLKVTLVRAEFEDDDDHPNAGAALRREALREALQIETVTDANGDEVDRSELRLRLHTLGKDDDYWIDTGLFQF